MMPRKSSERGGRRIGRQKLVETSLSEAHLDFFLPLARHKLEVAHDNEVDKDR